MKKELLANEKNNDQMCDYIKAKSLRFLSIDGLYKALGQGPRNKNYPQFSDHYFTGDYPIKPSDILEKGKITQLSLLSGKSNNQLNRISLFFEFIKYNDPPTNIGLDFNFVILSTEITDPFL